MVMMLLLETMKKKFNLAHSKERQEKEQGRRRKIEARKEREKLHARVRYALQICEEIHIYKTEDRRKE